MAAAGMIRDDPAARSSVSRRHSVESGSRRFQGSASLREAWAAPDVFRRSKREDDDEEELRWAAIERLPTYDRRRKGVLKQVLDNGRVVHEEVNVGHPGMRDKMILMENLLNVAEVDNQRFLQRLRDRTDR
ncbi:hypothetical protein U1Q18_042249 [Sarracenia purpurea var. burkii]